MRYFVAVFAVLVACNSESATKPLQVIYSRGVEQQSYIVVLKSGDPKAFARSHGVAAEHIYTSALRGFSARLSPQAAVALSNNPNVEAVETDGMVGLAGVQVGAPWNLDRTDQRTSALDGLYHYDRTGAGVHAYIIDSGIRTTHSDFTGRVGSGVDFTGTGSIEDCSGHGTHVAGILGGTWWGVAKDVLIHPVRVFACGQDSVPESRVIAAVDWVMSNGERPAVVNMSLGGLAAENPSLAAAVQNTIASGLSFVVAAGNDSHDACLNSPANVAAALTVGGSGVSDRIYSTSNYGDCVDLFAPAIAFSAWITSDTASTQLVGTSMSAPHVAGVVALYLEGRPLASPSEVSDSIKAYSTKAVVTASQSANCNVVYSFRSAETGKPKRCPR